MDNSNFGDAIDLNDHLHPNLGGKQRGTRIVYDLHHTLTRSGKSYEEAVAYIRGAKAQGVDIDGRDDTYGASPLCWAVGMKCPNQIAFALIDEGADIHARDSRGNSALSFAERYNNDAILDYIDHPESRKEQRQEASRKK